MAIEIPRVETPAARAGRDPEAGRAPRFAFRLSPPPIGARERMFFTERLALLLDTGTPLHTALQTLARQASHPDLQRLMTELRDAVSGGATFSQALSRHPAVFPATYVNLIGAAEQGGFLPTALDRLRDMEERREELRSTMVSALAYPGVLAFFSVAVVIFVLVVVFPKFDEIFSLIHDQLPITTRWLMATSDVLRGWWLPILIAIAAATHGASSFLSRPEGQAMLDRFMLATPGLRTIVVQLNVVQLLRVMSLSLGNGVPMVEALRSGRESVSSPHFRAFVADLERNVQEGRGLAVGFEREGLMPDLVKQLVATGDESGQLPVVMSRLADFYEREWRRALGVVAKVAEPAMLLFMGCVVGLIVSSLILPIFKLSRAVH